MREVRANLFCLLVSAMLSSNTALAAPTVSKGAAAAGVFFIRCESPSGQFAIYHARDILVKQGAGASASALKRKLRRGLLANLRARCLAPARITGRVFEAQGRTFGSKKECGPGKIIVDEVVPSVRAIAVRWKPVVHRARLIIYGWGWRFNFPATDALQGQALLNQAISLARAAIPPRFRNGLLGAEGDQKFESDLDAFTCEDDPDCVEGAVHGAATGGCNRPVTPDPSDTPPPIPPLPPVETPIPTIPAGREP